MSRFLAVFAIFLLSHLIAATPAIRRRLVDLLGEVLFTICYSAMSLTLFTWLIQSAQQAPYVELWPPQVWTYAITVGLMPVAALLFGAGLLQPNPFSIAFVATPFDPARPGAVAITRHPLLWGLGLWGLAHVPANGDLAAVLMFGGLGSFGFIGMWAVEARKRKVLGEEQWQKLAGPTSVLPFAALLSGRARWPTDRGTLIGGAIGLAVALWLVFGGHFWLFRRNPLAMF
jgi:uncharacterized membrane protein